jgi:hypothetical protein
VARIVIVGAIVPVSLDAHGNGTDTVDVIVPH